MQKFSAVTIKLCPLKKYLLLQGYRMSPTNEITCRSWGLKVGRLVGRAFPKNFPLGGDFRIATQASNKGFPNPAFRL